MSADHEAKKAVALHEEGQEASPVLGKPSPESVPVEYEGQTDAQEAVEPSFQEAPEGDL